MRLESGVTVSWCRVEGWTPEVTEPRQTGTEMNGISYLLIHTLTAISGQGERAAWDNRFFLVTK